MPHASTPWLAALESSSARLAERAAALTLDELDRPSFATDWSVAQVLSHLGSAAEISTTLLRRGIAGREDGPTAELVQPVWARWDGMSPGDQRSAWLEADARHRGALAELRPEDLDDVRIPYFSGLLDVATYAGYRLSEQSVHGWDIDVAMDDAAVIPAAEVDLLLERIDLVATRFRDGATLAELGTRQVAIELTDRPRGLTLDLGEELHLYPCTAGEAVGALAGRAEHVLRLVYGRHRPGDRLRVAGELALTDLQRLFPGY